jgi:uncharacterized protein HemX
LDSNLIACVLGACLVFELGLSCIAWHQQKKDQKARQLELQARELELQARAEEQLKLDKLLAAAPQIRQLVKG